MILQLISLDISLITDWYVCARARVRVHVYNNHKSINELNYKLSTNFEKSL
jgi:hypothetical protein